MPISFGSVGDIISICLIVKDLVAALDDSRGSASEYREVIRELWGLDRALLEVDLLSRTHENTIELNALCKTAQEAAKSCRECIEEFTKKIKKYGSALGDGASKNVLHTTFMKIRWVSQKDDITKFRAQVTAHVHSINMLLASAKITLMQVNDRKLNTRMTERADSQDAILVEVRDRLQENNNLISIGNTVARKIADKLRLDWIRQLSLDLKNMMEVIFSTNVATYKAVVALAARLPSYLERSMDEEPFIFEDPIGRIAPVHMRFITSWHAFDAVLDLRFQSTPGHRKIKNGEYVIQEHATRREIRRNLPWESSFLPGQRVDMTLIFENREQRVPTQVTCPRCQSVSSELQDSDINCPSCGMWYRRITEYNDVEAPSVPTIAAPRRKTVYFGQSSFGNVAYGPELPKNPTPTRSKRTSAEADLEEVEDVSLFKRVRMISKHDRIKSVFTAFSQHAATSGEAILHAKPKQEAEEQNARKLFEDRAAHLGMNHSDTHSSLNSLAWCLRNQRKFVKAEALFRAAYEARKDTLITEDAEALQTATMNLMTVLADQNKVIEIQELRQAAATLFRSNMDSDAAEVMIQRLQVVQILRKYSRTDDTVDVDLWHKLWQEIGGQGMKEREQETKDKQESAGAKEIIDADSRESSPGFEVRPEEADRGMIQRFQELPRCRECWKSKRMCIPRKRVWEEGGTQQKCLRCFHKQYKCGPFVPPKHRSHSATCQPQAQLTGDNSLQTPPSEISTQLVGTAVDGETGDLDLSATPNKAGSDTRVAADLAVPTIPYEMLGYKEIGDGVNYSCSIYQDSQISDICPFCISHYAKELQDESSVDEVSS